MTPYREILQFEFFAEEGSFLLQLHSLNTWDRQAFTRVITAMQECCEDEEGKPNIERWLAEGFWMIFGEVTTHVENLSRYPQAVVGTPEYYEEALARVFDLACWYFPGRSPFLPGSTLKVI
jgi:hypothetical protein